MHVLVVDDDEDVRAAVGALLQESGHIPSLAHDLQTALAICHAVKPDFVLLDINLIGEDGYTLADTLRKQCGLDGIQMWALSGYADDEERRRNSGIVGHILKPLTFNHVRALIGVTNRAA
jgi:two-component system, OmpR family, response regulator